MIKTTQEIIAKNKPDSLREHETVQIPEFDFDIEHNFSKIERYLSLFVEGPARVYQRIKFKLDEKGAVLKSEAIIVYEESRVIMARDFIVSKPFLIYLKQKDSSYPYFAIWVGNEEILMKMHQ
jgi:serine protease inhibitor